MKEFTTPSDVPFLVNMSHVMMVEKTTTGSLLVFDTNFIDPIDFNQKNCLPVKESYEYIRYTLSDNFDPNTRVPKRFN